VQAVDYFLANYRPPTSQHTVADVAADFVREKVEVDRVSPPVVNGYRQGLALFAKHTAGLKLHEIDADTCRRYVHAPVRGGGQPSRKSVNNRRQVIFSFLAWCMDAERGWIAANPAAAVKTFKVERDTPEVLTLDQVKEVMAYAETYSSGSMAPFMALVMFAGIRPGLDENRTRRAGGEMDKLGRLTTADLLRIVDLKAGVIRIPAAVSKVRTARTVKIQPNLLAWLAAYPFRKYPLVPTNAVRKWEHIRERFSLGYDVCRHTFITSHVTAFKSKGDTALQAGNSERMIQLHYLDPHKLTEDEAKAFWEIRPKAEPAPAADEPIRFDASAV
jgi:integrase